jgi:two-component system OmpR family sensor kinase
LRLLPTSLRSRLIVGVLVLVAAAIGAVSTITYVELRSFMTARVDGQLHTLPPGLASSCERRFDLPGPTPPIRVLVARLTSDGQVAPPCPGNGYQHPLELSAQDAQRLVARPGTPMEVGTPDGPVRALAQPSRAGGWDVLALPLGDVRATLDRLLVLELLVGALALVGAGTLGAVGVARGLRPLARVTDTAHAVAGEVAAGEVAAGDGTGADGPAGGGDAAGDGGAGSGTTGGGTTGGGTTGGGGLRRRVPEGEPGTEVGRLAEAFNTMLIAVQVEVAGRQASEQRMRQFLADASHELRTPLTSLRGYAELIAMREQRAGVQRDPESADSLRRITEEGARMARLVEDLLVLARSDERTDGPAGRRDDPVALDELAADAVADLRAAHPGRPLSLDAEPGCVVHGDPDQLRQVLNNLLVNAAVHTDGPVRVGVSRVAGEVRVVVGDDGPGLTPPQAARAFDRFWRADSARTRARGGSGLGLSIVDTLVGGHGGSIDFDTSPAAGTTVTVRLPAG